MGKVPCKVCNIPTSHKWEICFDCKNRLIDLSEMLKIIETHPEMIKQYKEYRD